MTEERLKEIEQFNSEPQPKGYNPCQAAELWELLVEVKRLRAGLEWVKSEEKKCTCTTEEYLARIDAILKGTA